MSQDRALDPLSGNLGYVVKQASTALHAAMDSALRPCGLTVSQYSCLELLARVPSQTNAQLARGMFVTPQSMNDVLRGLQVRGLVERPTGAETGRARPTRLTPEGLQSVERARAALEPVEGRVTGFARASEREQLLAGLRGFIQALDPNGARTGGGPHIEESTNGARLSDIGGDPCPASDGGPACRSTNR